MNISNTSKGKNYLQFDKGHGRLEKRLVETFLYNPCGNYHWDKTLAMVIKVTRERSVKDTKKKCYKSSQEVSFYVCSHNLPAKTCAKAIRKHWAIENSNHYVRDVSLREDHSRIRKNPDVFCTLRSFALNLLRSNGAQNISLTLYHNALSLPSLLAYRFIS